MQTYNSVKYWIEILDREFVKTFARNNFLWRWYFPDGMFKFKVNRNRWIEWGSSRDEREGESNNGIILEDKWKKNESESSIWNAKIIVLIKLVPLNRIYIGTQQRGVSLI